MSARRKPRPVNKADRLTRSLRALERTASTSRVLNLLAIQAQSGHRPEHGEAPLFRNRVLNSALVVKHLLRTACNEHSDMARDLATLRLIDQLPSLDPFLMREHLGRHGLVVASCYFALSGADMEQMQGFVSVEIERLIHLAYRNAGRATSGAHAARLVEALLSTHVDERLEPLRETLVMDGESFKEGVFSWKGFLYYKWMLTRLWPELNAVGGEIAGLTVTGIRDVETQRYVEDARQRLRRGVVVERNAIQRALEVYDRAFEDLIDNGRPQAFREFLLRAPDMFLSLGEKVGVIAHIASFWRYRFPPGLPVVADVDEAVDILQDFDAGLSASLAV